MELVLNSYSVILIGFSLVTFFLAVLVFNRLGLVAKWFSAVIAIISIWAAGYGVSIGQSTLSNMIFWIDVEYFGIALVPTVWFVFILKFTGRDCKLTRTAYAALFGFAFLTLAMVWTNPWHHLHYAEYHIKFSDPYYSLQFTRGPWYYVHVTYFYTLIASGMFVLVKSLRQSSGVFRKQSLVIFLGTLVPWIMNFAVVSGFKIFGDLDTTPLAFLFTSIVVGFGFLRFKLFDIVPMARDKVINVMREGWLVLDSQNRIIDYNPRMAWIMQKEGIGLTGLHFEGFIGAKQEEVDHLLDMNHEDDVDVEVEISGEVINFEVTCKTIQEHNTRSGRLLIFRDVTQYVKDQEKLQNQAAELRELNEVKNRLLSIISHDVRGPLAVLTQILEMSDAGDLSEGEVKEMLPKLGENLNNVTGFLENLLVWAKSQFEGEMIQPQIFDISEEISKSMELLEARIQAKKLQVTIHDGGEHKVFADPNMIRLVLRNILSNAVKFCRPGDQISFEIKRLNDFIRIAISDSGIGISEDNLKRIFSAEAFSTYGTEMEQGTGLGLMLSKDFVAKNNGKIWAESTAGKGSTFFFTIPTAPKSKEVSQYHSHSY